MQMCKNDVKSSKIYARKNGPAEIGGFPGKKGIKKEIKGYKNDQVSLHYGAY